jgi:Cd2+/Zn2+-exporting ATPase
MATAIRAVQRLNRVSSIRAVIAAFRLSQRARRVIRQNLVISMGMVVVLVTFAILGRIPLTVGVVGHEGSTVIVVMNSLRLLFGAARPGQASR